VRFIWFNDRKYAGGKNMNILIFSFLSKINNSSSFKVDLELYVCLFQFFNFNKISVEEPGKNGLATVKMDQCEIIFLKNGGATE